MSNLTEFLNPNLRHAPIEHANPKRKLRIGLIGTGSIAHAHMRSYLKCPDAEIVCGADLVPDRAEKFFAEFGLESAHCYINHKEMLAEETLDAVSVCTYNRQHAPCVIDALNAGVDVLVEKPFTVTVEEAAEVIKTEKKTGRILSVGFQPRFDPNMRMIKKIVQSGCLGKIYYIQTGGGRRRGIPASMERLSFIQDETAGIGALADIGCYSLDMVLNAIGYPKPLTVTGFTSSYFGTTPEGYPGVAHADEVAKHFNVDDFAGAFIRLEGGIVLDFRIAWAMNIDTPGDTILLGTKGGLRIPSTDCWNGSVGGPMTVYHQIANESVETVIPIIRDQTNCFDCKIRTFLDAVHNRTPAPVPSSEIFYNQAIIDGIVKSAKRGKEIEICLPEC